MNPWPRRTQRRTKGRRSTSLDCWSIPALAAAGSGRALLEHARREAVSRRGLSVLDVVDIPTAVAAIALYRAEGWQEIARVSGQIGSDMDESEVSELDPALLQFKDQAQWFDTYAQLRDDSCSSRARWLTSPRSDRRTTCRIETETAPDRSSHPAHGNRPTIVVDVARPAVDTLTPIEHQLLRLGTRIHPSGNSLRAREFLRPA